MKTDNGPVLRKFEVTNIRNGYCDIEVSPAGNYSPLAEEVGLEDGRLMAAAPELLEFVIAVRDMMRDSGKRIPIEYREGVYKKANDLIQTAAEK